MGSPSHIPFLKIKTCPSQQNLSNDCILYIIYHYNIIYNLLWANEAVRLFAI